MAMTLTADLTKDSGISQEFNQLYQVIRRATRAYLVSGLTDGSLDQSATALARALGAFGVPLLGDAYDNIRFPGCVCTRHDLRAAEGTDDAVELVASFETLLPGGPNTTSLFIETDDDCEVEATTQLLMPLPGDVATQPIQITVDYDPSIAGTPPTDPPTPKGSKPANTSFPQTIRRLVLQGVVVATSLDSFRGYRSYVNDQPWHGLPKGYWRFTRFSTQTGRAGGIFVVNAEITTWQTKNWAVYEVYYSPQLGQFVSVDPAVVKGLNDLPYSRGVLKANGITKVGHYFSTDFLALFGIA